MINVNQITSFLARMPDQALQRYAAMHKDDPYTMSLALAESNRRKQMRQGAQGNSAPMPNVVDQALAEMTMPEDVGIGALPAPNMQGMAEGGIVAFGGGGDVPGYQVGGDTMGGFMPDPEREALNALRFDEPTRLREIAELEQKAAFLVAAGAPQAAAVQAQLAALKTPKQGVKATMPETGYTRSAMASDPRRASGFTTPKTPPKVSPPVDEGIKRLMPVTALAEKSFLDRLNVGMGTGVPEDPFADRRAKNTADAKAEAEQGLASLKADQAAEEASIFKGRETRIGKREAALDKSKDTNTGMAFLEAGLAMMQARGPGLAAIAQGAGVGVKAYSAGIDKIKSAQEKLDEARDRIEELRQNQSSMNKREVRAEEKGIRTIVNQGNQEALRGAEQAYGLRRDDVRAAVASDISISEAGKTREFQAEQGKLDRQSRAAIAKLPSAQVQMIEKLGGGNFAKGYELYKQEASIPRLYEAYIKAAEDPLKPEFKAKYPTFDTYLAGMGGGKGSGIIDIPDAAAAAVRTR